MNKLNNNTFVREVEEVLDEKVFQPDFNVRVFARSLFTCRGNLYKKIKKHYNQSPVKLIRGRRLQAGKDLLLNSNLRINEVADAVGYTDQAYFSRVFRNEFGVCPKKIRI